MAENAPENQPTTDGPDEASPHSAEPPQQAPSGANDEPGPEERVVEEEERGDADKPQPPQPAGGPQRRRWLAKRSMEYELAAMYPEVQLLVEQKRRQWNYGDPDVIRALFLEAKTNALAEWKVGRAVVAKRKRPLIEVQETAASKLRRQHLAAQHEQRQSELRRDERMYNRQQPEFAEVKLATNATAQLRYNYTRNNPPVPGHFLAHYERFRKPPFQIFGVGSKGCRLVCRPGR